MGPPPPCLNLGKLLDRTSIPDQRPGGDRTARAVLSCLASSSGAVEAGATAEFDARLTTFDVPIADATDVARLVPPLAFTMLATVNKRRGSSAGSLDDAIDRVAALGAGVARADLSNALKDIDLDTLPGETGEETADRVWRPTHRLGDLRPAGTILATQCFVSLVARGAATEMDAHFATSAARRSATGRARVLLSLPGGSSHSSSRA